MKKFSALVFVFASVFNTTWAMDEMQVDPQASGSIFDMSTMREALDDLVYTAKNQTYDEFVNDFLRKYSSLNAELTRLGMVDQTKVSLLVAASTFQQSNPEFAQTLIKFGELKIKIANALSQRDYNKINPIIASILLFTFTRIVSDETTLKMCYLTYSKRINSPDDIPADYLETKMNLSRRVGMNLPDTTIIRSITFFMIKDLTNFVEQFYTKIKQNPALEDAYNDLRSGLTNTVPDGIVDAFIPDQILSLLRFDEGELCFLKNILKSQIAIMIKIFGDMRYLIMASL